MRDEARSLIRTGVQHVFSELLQRAPMLILQRLIERDRRAVDRRNRALLDLEQV